MESVRLSFGKRGSVLFSVANMLQLVGWTAVMIYAGATVSSALGKVLWDGESFVRWALANGALIVLWLVFGARKTGGLKTVSMLLMLFAVLWLSAEVFSPAGSPPPGFRRHEFRNGSRIVRRHAAFLAAAGRRLHTPSTPPVCGNPDGNARLYADGLLDVCLGFGSGVVHRRNRRGKNPAGRRFGCGRHFGGRPVDRYHHFLDAYSAGVSANNISAKLSETPIAVAVAVVGTLLAVLLPVTEYENFLLLIGSVFAPMAAVLIADFSS